MDESYRIILLYIIGIVGGLACVKGIFMILLPRFSSRTVAWWCNRSHKIMRIIGNVIFIVGIGCISIIAIAVQNILIATTLVIGMLLLVVGVLYHFPEATHAMMRPWCKDAPVRMRITGTIAIVIGIALLTLVFLRGTSTRTQKSSDSTPTTQTTVPAP